MTFLRSTLTHTYQTFFNRLHIYIHDWRAVIPEHTQNFRHRLSRILMKLIQLTTLKKTNLLHICPCLSWERFWKFPLFSQQFKNTIISLSIIYNSMRVQYISKLSSILVIFEKKTLIVIFTCLRYHYSNVAGIHKIWHFPEISQFFYAYDKKWEGIWE